jgi:ribosomal-protein-alanine N-acetyltransferase
VRLTVEPATAAEHAELESWRYDPPYDFYDGDADPVLNPERYFIARDEAGELVGFYSFEARGETLEYGLGLRPELAGKGLGAAFVEHGLELGRRLYRPERIVLSVAGFNARAIAVYERCGFRETGRHVRHFERFGDVEFVDMEEAR